MQIEPWMLEAVAYYQRHSFFRALTPGLALEKALRLYGARWDAESSELADLLQMRWEDERELSILALDEERCLDLDFEVLGVGGSSMYVDTIPRIARITRGVFSAWSIEETALDAVRSGRVHLSFRVGSERFEYEVGGGNSDFIDGKIFWIIQEFLTVSPYRFYAAAESIPDSQGAMFVVLTQEERDAIEADRGIAFVPLPPQPAQPWDWDVEALLTKSSRS
jgi:hypothetical protein